MLKRGLAAVAGFFGDQRHEPALVQQTLRQGDAHPGEKIRRGNADYFPEFLREAMAREEGARRNASHRPGCAWIFEQFDQQRRQTCMGEAGRHAVLNSPLLNGIADDPDRKRSWSSITLRPQDRRGAPRIGSQDDLEQRQQFAPA